MGWGSAQVAVSCHADSPLAGTNGAVPEREERERHRAVDPQESRYRGCWDHDPTQYEGPQRCPPPGNGKDDAFRYSL